MIPKYDYRVIIHDRELAMELRGWLKSRKAESADFQFEEMECELSDYAWVMERLENLERQFEHISDLLFGHGDEQGALMRRLSDAEEFIQVVRRLKDVEDALTDFGIFVSGPEGKACRVIKKYRERWPEDEPGEE